MGLFGSLGGFFSTAAKAVLTGGISLVAPKLIPSFIAKPLTQLTTALAPTSLSGILRTGVGVATANPALLTGNYFEGRPPMALNIGQILSGVSGIFGGAQNPYFQGISNITGAASQFFPQSAARGYPVAQRQLPMVIPPVFAGPRALGRVGGVVGRKFFDKYPNLAASIQGFRDAGKNVKRSQLWSMLKRFGPDILITGGILTAASIAELIMAGPGHRRMNAGNAKALRRSLRRLDAFHHLCVRADKYRGGRRRRAPAGKIGSAPQFVRQG